MDMDIDTEDSQAPHPTASLTLDKLNAPPNGPQALEDYRDTAETSTHPNAHTTPTPESSRHHSRHPSNTNTDQKSSSPISMSTPSRQDRNETSTTATTTTSSSSGAIVSPPSSYSSNASSSMDALAKTLSPARVDIHRKRIQRMLQQNSLLWWELVRVINKTSGIAPLPPPPSPSSSPPVITSSTPSTAGVIQESGGLI
ncbi:hypothetical protein BGZ96_002378 [Linnemannia gamsii]|uniref:Uncharacterized protein n=1 Tax=Linnemannia gamsii TaxID=64522 RepID=A0ABQ7KAP7_9FUNG|nr:hypothetical protein BGZ96_002378 [Linnemannia gamsii]